MINAVEFIVIASGVNGDSFKCVGTEEEAELWVAALVEDGCDPSDISVYEGVKRRVSVTHFIKVQDVKIKPRRTDSIKPIPLGDATGMEVSE